MDLLKELTKDPIPQELAFPESEYLERVARARKAMETQELDALLVTYLPHQCYLTGFQQPVCEFFNCFILPREGEAVMVTPVTEVPLALLHGWVRNVVSFRRWMPEEGPSKVAQVLREQGLSEKRIGAEFRREGLTPFIFEQVRGRLPGARFVDASDLVMDLRLIKSPAEIAHMRQAARYTDIGMQAALAAIGPGVLDNEVAAVAQDAMIRAGSEYFSIDPFVVSGHRTGIQHTTYKRFSIKKGDSVYVELSGAYHRYSAPLFRTASVGPPSDTLKRLAETSVTCLNTLLDSVKPGRPIAEVVPEVKEHLKPLEGHIYPRSSIGYTVGLDFPPDWGEEAFFISESNQRAFEPGMVFHSPQSIRLIGRVGVSFSECWAVTEKGAEPFCTTARELTIVA